MDSWDAKREFFLLSKSIKTSHQKSFHKTISPKHGILWQRGAKIDAQTHQKSMPKLVTKKKSLILSKFMFSQMVKSCKIIRKTMFFEGLTGCLREQKMYQHSKQMDTQIHAKLVNNRSRHCVRKSSATISENHST